jgi:hypothetical protein
VYYVDNGVAEGGDLTIAARQWSARRKQTEKWGGKGTKVHYNAYEKDSFEEKCIIMQFLAWRSEKRKMELFVIWRGVGAYLLCIGNE